MKHKSERKDKEKVGLFIPKREASWAIAVFIGLAFLIFMTGYFWGQRRAVSQFLGKLEDESFSDKITYSLYTMNGKYLSDSDEEDEEPDPGEESAEEEKEMKAEPVKVAEIPPMKEETIASTVTYIAPLVGFGTLHAANKFAQRVKKMGITVHVKRRISKSPKGRTIAWYQVVTDVYSDKNEIEHVVMRIKDKEKIKDVKIIERKKGYATC